MQNATGGLMREAGGPATRLEPGATLISYYGDDFTGSTDVMEALSSNGVETVLFTEVPTEELRNRFAECRGVGLAGKSRSQTPDWMDRELPAVFAWLKGTGAMVSHYKICSTFDSAPHLGSIGRALEIGLREFGQSSTSIVIGAPELRRYTAFATLFADYGGDTHRIDRHPVMSRHPATPMGEADLRKHLARQTDLATDLIDVAALLDGNAQARLEQALASGASALFVDVLDSRSQARAGELLWDNLGRIGPLMFGSSGVEYALIRAWRIRSLLPERPGFPPLPTRDRILVVSGSCSATTDGQIAAAEKAGFEAVPLDYAAIATGQAIEAKLDHALAAAAAALSRGRSPILFTARGPEAVVRLPRESRQAADDRVGRTLGSMLHRLRAEHALHRVIIAGGDTSGHALSELGVKALTLRHPIPGSPGSPVCKAHFGSVSEPDLEIVLKGGQVGAPDFFLRVRSGELLR